jgi:transcription antitermination factor NusG
MNLPEFENAMNSANTELQERVEKAYIEWNEQVRLIRGEFIGGSGGIAEVAVKMEKRHREQ